MPTPIHQAALLVNLSISAFNAKRKDQRVSQEAIAQNHASDDAGNFVKSLVSREAIAPIQNASSAARSYHLANTLPWQDGGGRIIPAAHYAEYKLRMEALKTNFNAAVAVFCAGYAAAIEEAKVRLGSMFVQSDYPSDVRERFEFRTTCYPIPSGSDFRIQITPEEREVLSVEIEQSVRESVDAGVLEVLGRATGCLETIVERLGKPDSIFRDTLIGNLVEIARMIPIFNVTDNPNLTLLSDIIQPMTQVNPADLRTNPARRQEVYVAARNALEGIRNMTVADEEEV